MSGRPLEVGRVPLRFHSRTVWSSLPVTATSPFGLIATDVTNEWGLISEPWIFAVDREGIVRGSYELTITPAELDAILPVITAGG